VLFSKATYNVYVRGCMPLEQLGVKCLAQGHVGVSQWIQTRVSHTNGMCAITAPSVCIKVRGFLKQSYDVI